jgi:imidazole glycerol-phosphate synthase subunit HisF
MLKTRVIPCMLFDGFSLVKTIRFSNSRNLGNPTQAARVYNSRNVDELIFIDLKASQEKRLPFFSIIEEVFKECFMPLTVGGGIHSIKTAEKLLRIGADKICINSEAIDNPKFITRSAKKFGSQSLVVSIDVKTVNKNHYVFSEKGKKNTRVLATDWAKKVQDKGAGEIFLTSVDQDGVMEGYDLALIKKVTRAVSIPVIVCGGAGKARDVVDAVKIGGANAVSFASMLHYTENTPNSIKEKMNKANIPVRII